MAAREKRERGEAVEMGNILRADPFFQPIAQKIDQFEKMQENPVTLTGACVKQVRKLTAH